MKSLPMRNPTALWSSVVFFIYLMLICGRVLGQDEVFPSSQNDQEDASPQQDAPSQNESQPIESIQEDKQIDERVEKTKAETNDAKQKTVESPQENKQDDEQAEETAAKTNDAEEEETESKVIANKTEPKETNELYSLYYKAGALYLAGKLTRAKEIYQKVAKMAPDDAHIHALLASVWLRLRDRKEAVQQINKALTLSPNQPEYHAMLGNIERSFGDHTGAQKAYIEALALDGNNKAAREGIEYYTNNMMLSVKIKPKLSQEHIPIIEPKSAGPVPEDTRVRGDWMLLAWRYAEAIAIYRDLVSKQPKNGRVYAKLARAKIGEREAKGAIAAAKTAAALSPKSSLFLAILGDAYRIGNDRAAARDAYMRAIGLDRNNELARRGIASLRKPAVAVESELAYSDSDGMLIAYDRGFEPDAGGFRDYLESIREIQPQLYAELDGDVSSLQTRETIGTIFEWSGTFVIASSVLYQVVTMIAFQTNYGMSISGVLGGSILYLVGRIVEPGEGSYQEVVDKHNRLNSVQPLELRIGMTPSNCSATAVYTHRLNL